MNTVEGTKLGTCTRCRTRTAVTPVKLERANTVSDPHPVDTELCGGCIERLATLRITKLAQPEVLTYAHA